MSGIGSNVFLQRSLLSLALLALYGLSFFVYRQYPAEWRKRRRIRTFLVVFHALGNIAIALIFNWYAKIPYRWLKYANSIYGSIYLIALVIQAVLCTAKLALRHCIACFLHNKKTLLRSQETAVSFMFTSIALVIAFAGFVNSTTIQVNRYDVAIPKSADSSYMDIVLISDIHAGAGLWESTYERIEQMANACKPDVILLAGDIFDETTSEEDVARLQEMIAKLDSRYGIFFVYGNHDALGNNVIEEALRAANVRILRDEMAVLENGVQLIGRIDPAWAGISPVDLWTKYKVNTSQPIMVLQHRPIGLGQLADLGSDLVFAGHTHGYNVPFFLSVAMVNDMVAGIKTFGDMTAVTSNGAGAWGIRYKWPSTNDIVHIHVRFEGDPK